MIQLLRNSAQMGKKWGKKSYLPTNNKIEKTNSRELVRWPTRL